MKNERVAIYIDGGNTILVSKRYYIGIVKNNDQTNKGEAMVKSQQKFLEGLRSDGFEIKHGKIMYDGGKIREKGVDVKIAIDLVVGAADDLCDTAIIISSDTDLIPAVKYVKNAKNKKVEYISFGERLSLGMIKECSTTRTFSDIDIEKFKVSNK